MKRILLINSVFGYGSTGRIVEDVYEKLDKSNVFEAYAIVGRKKPIYNSETYNKNHIYCVYNKYLLIINMIKSILFKNHGLNNKVQTYKIIKLIKKIKPDIIHVHNLHGFYINYEILFDYIKSTNIKVVMTLHDCWEFTGYCTYYTGIKCKKWRDGCIKCKEWRSYPYRIPGNISKNYYKKQQVFNIDNIEKLIVPTFWLKNEIEFSLLKDKECNVIYNGVNPNYFKLDREIIKEIDGKKILLGVANVWDKRKGLDYYIKLSYFLPEDYKIIIIGLSKNQLRMYKSNDKIEFKGKQKYIEDLVYYYRRAKFLLNFSIDESFSLVNLESQMCGTPVISLDGGGNGETAKLFGETLDDFDIQKILEIINNKNENSYVNHSFEYTTTRMINKNIEIYNKLKL